MEGKTQETAAAKAGMSVRSARKWQRGPLPSPAKAEHRWCTRPDPFDGVWEDEIEPLLRSDPTGKLKAHCLNKNVTQRDWLPQITCYPNCQASSKREKSRILDECIPKLTSGGYRPPSQAWHQVAWTLYKS